MTRTPAVATELRLTGLHLAPQPAKGWDNSHRHDFTAGRSRGFPYTYDTGDSREHAIKPGNTPPRRAGRGAAGADRGRGRLPAG